MLAYVLREIDFWNEIGGRMVGRPKGLKCDSGVGGAQNKVCFLRGHAEHLITSM